MLRVDALVAHARAIVWVRRMAGYSPTPDDPPLDPALPTYSEDIINGLLWILTEVLVFATTWGIDVPMAGGEDPKPVVTAGVKALGRADACRVSER